MPAKLERHPSSRRIVLSLVLLLAVALFSTFGIIFYSVKQVNEESRITSEGYVAAIIEDKLKQHEALTKDYAYWDDTIKHAYLSTNREWINENLGEYLTESFNITDLFIINSQNEAVLSIKDGQFDKSSYSTINQGTLTELIGKARQSGPVPVPVSGIIMINGTPAIVALSILASDDLSPFPAPRPLLLKAIRLSPDYLHTLSKQYRLRDLKFSPVIQDDIAVGSVDIKDPLKNILGTLSWQADKPGDLVLTKIQLPLFLLLIVIVIIVFFIIKMSRLTARNLEQAYEDLTYNANHDELTGLANRRLFNELLKLTIRSVKRDHISSTMLYIDLDNFKDVNDTLGHTAGDKLLIIVAERLQSSVRESDTIARIGGDEFMILLQNTNGHEHIKATVEKIMAHLSQPVMISDVELQISASIGVTVIPSDGVDPDVLMTKADLALYSSKDLGRNTFQFFSDTGISLDD